MTASPPIPEEPLSSPCISVCTLDPSRSYCIGCLRTVKEIGAWRTMSEAEKRTVVTACRERAADQPPRSKNGQPINS